MTQHTYQWPTWRHLTKLDPDRTLTEAEIKYICLSGTDALVIGGTQGIVRPKVEALLRQLAPYPLPKVIEVSSREAVVPGADLYFIPMVLNGGTSHWLIGAHQETVKALGPLIPWKKIVQEGYIILNPLSAAAQLTAAIELTEAVDVAAYALCGERLMNLPVIYLEYSGTYGDPNLVRTIKRQIKKSQLFYGGGIDSGDKAHEMAQIADTIVVGNMIYEGKLELLPETVRRAKEPKIPGF